VKKKIIKLKGFIYKASYYKGICSLVIDVILHKLLINTDPRDYFKFEFYKNEKSFKEKGRYVSLLGSRYFPHGNNCLKFNKIFTNKYIQKAILQYLELPTPKMVTTIGKNNEISNKSQMNSFLKSLDLDIVIKPIMGTHGKGFLSITKKGKRYYSDCNLYTKDMIWNHIKSGFVKGYIVEEKIINIESLRSINASSLNTYRIIMIKTKDGKWHNACSFLKFGKDGCQVDNLSAGGIMAEVDDDGKTICAYDYITLKPITKHPNSFIDLVGIELEDYKEVKKLAFKASKKFNFMGSIGWDIASTVRGPIIIEANAWWGEPQNCLKRGIITEEIAKGLKTRTIFSTWDKTKMYPGFYKDSFFKRSIQAISNYFNK
jgi:hypothetical protein